MSKMCFQTVLFALVACSFYYIKETSAGSCDTVLFDSPVADNSPVNDVERNQTLHLTSWDGIIKVVSRRLNALDLAWKAPSDSTNLCLYRVHFYSAGAGGISGSRYSKAVKPDQLSVTIDGLSPGTLYHVFVEAAFNKTITGSTTDLLLSYVLGVKTVGFGPDNPCNCFPLGTKNGDVNNCDSSTGQCDCINAETSGLRCNSCVDFAYMNSQLGCTTCDQCNKGHANGTCVPVLDGTDMQCNCRDNFVGKHCTECPVNFYLNDSNCLPCDCNNNQMANSTPICNSLGICLLCDFNTHGDHCQQCYPGYVGDALKRTCELESHVGKDVAISILVILLIVVVIAITLFIVRRCVRQRRLGQFRGLGAGGGSSGSGINFKELNEEHDASFRQSGRKLQIVNA